MLAILFLCLAVLVVLSLVLWQKLRQARTSIDALIEAQRNASIATEARLRGMLDGMIEGVLLLAPEGQVEFANLSLRRLVNLSGEARGLKVQQLFSQPEVTDLVRRVQSEGAVIGSQLELSTPARRNLQVNASVFARGPGQPDGVLLIFHDVTRLQDLENTRKEFVANVSHELRTPLSLIKGFVETLLSGSVTDPGQAKQFLVTIEKHANRLAYLIDDLLTISKLENGQGSLNFHPVPVWDLVERVREDLSLPAAERGITIDNQIAPDLWANADSERLQQVFFNLVENAIKYGRQQGQVIIGAKPIPGDRIQLWVQDDGPGIPPEAKERVFERFYRVERARSPDKGGTGLGLSIVKHIVQAHQGEVWLQSQPGSGATFYFTLPRAPAAQA
jgi:two-component system, OmpR family, phosphate regulon sensor histidine kinase PhoR